MGHRGSPLEACSATVAKSLTEEGEPLPTGGSETADVSWILKAEHLLRRWWKDSQLGCSQSESSQRTGRGF